jgi:hypothetical protein
MIINIIVWALLVLCLTHLIWKITKSIRSGTGIGLGVSEVIDISGILFAIIFGYNTNAFSPAKNKLSGSASVHFGCYGGFILPETISSTNILSTVEQDLRKLRTNDLNISEFHSTPIAEGIQFQFLIQNQSNQPSSVILRKSDIKVKVETESISETVNIYGWGPCPGGAGAIFRYFEPIGLVANNKPYRLNTKYISSRADDNYDYFTLQSSESEIFSFSFECKEPGKYKMIIEIDYSFEANTTMKLLSPTITAICPNKLNAWHYDEKNRALKRIGFVTVDQLRLRKNPALSNDNIIIDNLPRGKQLTLTGNTFYADNINWLEVQVDIFESKPVNLTGWVSSEFVSLSMDNLHSFWESTELEFIPLYTPEGHWSPGREP